MEKITLYKKTKRNAYYWQVFYISEDGLTRYPTAEKGIVKELPKGIKLTYANTI